MTLSPRSFLQQLQSAVLTAAQLLAPASADCLLCGKPHRTSRSAPIRSQLKLTPRLRQNVCGACLSAIPWLTRIVCPKCGRGIHCADCARSPHPSFIYSRSAVNYDPFMRQLLAQYKYRGKEQLAPLLGDMLLPAFESMTASLSRQLHMGTPLKQDRKPSFTDYWNAVTYVPISRERALDRGFNQAEQLAAHLAVRYRLPLMRLLARNRDTEKQSFKSRSDRLKNTNQLFVINPVELQRLMIEQHQIASRGQLLTRRILLIDDIYTTGSTVEACSEVLRKSVGLSLEIYILTWARS